MFTTPVRQHLGVNPNTSQSNQPVLRKAQDNQSKFCSPDIRQPNLNTEQPITFGQKKLAASSIRLRGPRDLTVEVRINGKQTRCLVDTGAAVSVLDAKHFSGLYGCNLPPLKPNDLDSIRTAWYLVRYRMANKWSTS